MGSKAIKRFLGILLGLGLVLAWPQTFLFLKDARMARIYGAIPVHTGSTFEIEWIHSVELQPWKETYRVDENGMKLVSTSFRSFGAGVPSDAPMMDVKNGWIVINGMEESRDSVSYLISRTDYRLRVGNREWKLSDIVPIDTALSFSVETRPWWYGFLYNI